MSADKLAKGLGFTGAQQPDQIGLVLGRLPVHDWKSAKNGWGVNCNGVAPGRDSRLTFS